MAITFPSTPRINQTFTSSSRTWKWNGFAWDAVLDIPTGGGGAGLSGDPGTHVTHNIDADHFYPVISSDRNGTGRKVLVLQDDGTVGFEYIFFHDVFKPSEFTFTIGSFTLGGSTSKTALIGPSSSNFNLGVYGSFAVTYPSLTVEPVSAQISGNFVSGSPISLASPFTSLSTSGLSIPYPVGDDPTSTFTLTAVGENEVSQTKTTNIVFPNNFYYGTSTLDFEDNDILSQNLTAVLRTGTQLVNGYSFVVNSDLGEAVWFAYPYRHGKVKKIVDPDANEDKTNRFARVSVQSHINPNNFEESYNIYRSSQLGQGEENLRITVDPNDLG